MLKVGLVLDLPAQPFWVVQETSTPRSWDKLGEPQETPLENPGWEDPSPLGTNTRMKVETWMSQGYHAGDISGMEVAPRGRDAMSSGGHSPQL